MFKVSIRRRESSTLFRNLSWIVNPTLTCVYVVLVIVQNVRLRQHFMLIVAVVEVFPMRIVDVTQLKVRDGRMLMRLLSFWILSIVLFI
jgi:hypothetical protein